MGHPGQNATAYRNPYTGQVIATVNEDLNSSLFSIDPWSGHVTHYWYSRPLPHHGRTDAISFYNGQMLISASAPGTTGAAAPNPAYPAVYSVTLDQATHVAFFHACSTTSPRPPPPTARTSARRSSWPSPTPIERSGAVGRAPVRR